MLIEDAQEWLTKSNGSGPLSETGSKPRYYTDL